MEKELKLKIANEFRSSYEKMLKNEKFLIEKIKSFFGFEENEMTFEKKNLIDVYYDTNKFDLKNQKSLMRIRKDSKSFIFTIKYNQTEKNGIFKRSEKEFSLNKQDVVTLQQSNFQSAVSLFFPKLSGASISEAFTINNKRKIINIEKASGEIYEIALDDFDYLSGLTKLNDRKNYSIEVEAKNDLAEENIEQVKNRIENLKDVFEFETKSKYENGFEYLSKLPLKKIIICTFKDFELNLKRIKIVEARNLDDASTKFQEKYKTQGIVIGEIVNGQTIISLNKINKTEEICKSLRRIVFNEGDEE